MSLQLTLVEDKEPQKNGWYIVQNLNKECGYTIAQYMGNNEWWGQDSFAPRSTKEFPWYWDNPLVNVQAGKNDLISS